LYFAFCIQNSIQAWDFIVKKYIFLNIINNFKYIKDDSTEIGFLLIANIIKCFDRYENSVLQTMMDFFYW